MKFFYPVIIEKQNNGSFHAVFPDLEQCEAYGETMDDVLDRATDAAAAWIDAELQEDEPELPSATDPADISAGPCSVVRMILVNYKFTDGWDE